jgi:uncharacterized membrane protein YedE/YeeE
MKLPMFLLPLLGGMLVGCAALLLLLGSGRIAGYSGIIFNAILQRGPRWRWLFLAGTLGGGLLISWVAHLPFHPLALSPTIIMAGLLVGIGTRLGNGCTSGHGICGVGRLSARSMIATCVFVACGIITASCFYGE